MSPEHPTHVRTSPHGAGQSGESRAPVLDAFGGYGVEIEYMIVDRDGLDVRPIADELLCLGAGHPAADVVRGDMGWSNELALHVLEVKNRVPSATLDALPEAFHAEITAINTLLGRHGAQLLPGGMHPWMDPHAETRLWTHENCTIYSTYDRIFDCRRHGWGNLQSVHLNLPFGDDEQFARLHAAIRLVLPILPALAASSPIADGHLTGFMDYRLEVYRDHQRQLPSSIGECIPRPSASPAEYRAQILAPMYREAAEYGDGGVLQHEWLNVRAAIPRFERNAIEIRVLDVQECPQADLAIAAVTAALVQRLYASYHSAPDADATIRTAALVRTFRACLCDAERTQIDDASYLAQLGLDCGPCRAHELWARVIDLLVAEDRLAPRWHAPLQLILERGPLARRIVAALGEDAGRLQMREIYRELGECLRDNRQFEGTA
ncbi:carboxylate-amine ligase [Aromatoleum buckelii]|uniref:Glutamate--cysteine ligase n=1 Tax=Aromatoleum buckelii TaxID=200254 RepID=A0ABX1N1K9_9RHOO|nr:glutamate-cysteine ligase family protein [Aromatoleum buckelii]MCK0512605.1 glutamate-cysteine ligase family protein [Aromatoleum buckelii]